MMILSMMIIFLNLTMLVHSSAITNKKIWISIFFTKQACSKFKRKIQQIKIKQKSLKLKIIKVKNIFYYLILTSINIK